VEFAIDIEGAYGIGDQIQLSSIPEAFYKKHGKKLIDVNKSWIFDYNPYVVRDVYFPELKFRDQNKKRIYLPVIYSKDLKTIRQLWSKATQNSDLSRSYWFYLAAGVSCDWDLLKLDFPRGPRLYKYEDPKNVNPTQISIHIGPSNSAGRYIPNSILKTIKQRYSNYDIIQVGSIEDNSSPFIDKRGVDLWESVKIIAQSAIFIGINSGPMHIANCYPHINKKYLITSNIDTSISTYTETDESIATFRPLTESVGDDTEWGTWVDYGWQYYNSTEYDMGCTYSYNKI
tara:strand:- start:169 stop:1029 length:861 start_codon:yes stop_codon:yes gene_type:complete